MTEYDYFRDLNNYFGTMWDTCKNGWYTNRGKYTHEEEHKMFQLFLNISGDLLQIKKIAKKQTEEKGQTGGGEKANE